ncbi:MAG TPA: amidohydrolase family protein, partial [Ktedonobacteraceae bacterium]|nr:amidohydrolase family protein [Ktedonobacteraceae bacterium]
MKHFAPAYVYTSEGLQANKIISISDDGIIDSISDVGAQFIAPPSTEIESLPNIALLPGFVNVHSHVFQRALRGHTHRPLSRHDTFWTWRNAMYAEAQRLNPDTLYALALTTYREMLAAGYTTVGEFHYVHHQPHGQPYAEPNAMSEAILQAGREAGIQVVLLM